MAAIYLLDHRLTFVHIPKNAGSSVGRWLRDNFKVDVIKSHPTLSTLKEVWPIEKSFTTIRNPWERIVSAYFYLKKDGSAWELNNIQSDKDFPSWNDFIDRLDYNIANWYTIETNQIDWLGNGVDWVLRVENLIEDFTVIQDYLNCYAPLPYINTSEHGDYRSYYTEEQRNRIRRIFERDIETFKYTF